MHAASNRTVNHVSEPGVLYCLILFTVAHVYYNIYMQILQGLASVIYLARGFFSISLQWGLLPCQKTPK